MMNMKSISKTVEAMVEMINDGEVVFSNIVQRGTTWKPEQMSLLIHSICEGFPIPVFFARSQDGILDMLDGKQRGTTLARYLNDEFALTAIPEVIIFDKETRDEEYVDISGKKFSELPEDIQKRINRYSLTISYDENISDDEASEMFYRLNNGKALSASEKSWAKTKSIYEIDALGSLPLFTVDECMTASAFAKKDYRDTVKKMFSILCMTKAYDETTGKWIDRKDINKDSSIVVSLDAINWDAKDIGEWLEKAPLTQDVSDKITELCDVIVNVHAKLIEKSKMKDEKKEVVNTTDTIESTEKDSKETKTKKTTKGTKGKAKAKKPVDPAETKRKHYGTVAKKIYAKNHMLAVFYLMSELDKDDRDVTTDMIAEFLNEFFVCNKNGTTKSANYNAVSRGGTGHAPSIATRHEEILKAFNRFYKNAMKKEEVVESPVETPVTTETTTDTTTETVDDVATETVETPVNTTEPTDETTKSTETEVDPIDNLEDEPVDEEFEKAFGNYDGYEIDDEELDVDFEE